MKNGQKRKKDVYVTIILTESTTSQLNLSIPHLEHLHPENSHICLITPSEYKLFEQRANNDREKPSTSKDCKLEEVDEICLKISSDIALFSMANFSSSSLMYYISEDNIQKLKNASESKFQATKVHHFPLVSARSIAHSNKLNTQANDIYVSLLENDSRTPSECLCRICHGGESYDDLLTPCRCRGTVALVHLKCLERWLRESNHSQCELCQHHFKIIREPKYSVPWSILVFLRHPGSHLKEILLDLVAFSLYTPCAIASTYMLMMMCEQLAKTHVITSGTFSSHIIAFSAVFGMAAIDFTYSSWILVTFQKHIEAWREWYSSSSTLKVVLPKIKLRPHRVKKKKKQTKK